MTSAEVERKPATVALLPWLRMAEPCEVGGVRFLPVDRFASPLTSDEFMVVWDLGSRYWAAEKLNIDHFTLAHIVDKSLVESLADDEVNHIFAMAELLAFAGLSKREFFSFKGYCNRDTFRLVVSDLQNPPDPSKGFRVSARRRDGSKSIGAGKGSLRQMRPLHVDGDEVEIDAALLEALNQAAMSGSQAWSAIQEAILGFNLSNTDSPDVSLQTEIILLLGAMQRLLDTGSDCKQLRAAFGALIRPATSLAPQNPPCAKCTQDAIDASTHLSVKSFATVTDALLQDLCNLRGNVAHGRLDSPYVSFWSMRSHLLLASYIFPFLVKARLQQLGYYCMTEEDQSRIDVFEALACEEHFAIEDTESAEAELAGSYKPHPWDLLQRQRMARLLVAQRVIPKYANPWVKLENPSSESKESS